jgi:hypothetical protein
MQTKSHRQIHKLENTTIVMINLTLGARRPPKRIIPLIREKQVA